MPTSVSLPPQNTGVKIRRFYPNSGLWLSQKPSRIFFSCVWAWVLPCIDIDIGWALSEYRQCTPVMRLSSPNLCLPQKWWIYRSSYYSLITLVTRTTPSESHRDCPYITLARKEALRASKEISFNDHEGTPESVHLALKDIYQNRYYHKKNIRNKLIAQVRVFKGYANRHCLTIQF